MIKSSNIFGSQTLNSASNLETEGDKKETTNAKNNSTELLSKKIEDLTYEIQTKYISKIEGDYNTVVGLPVQKLYQIICLIFEII